MLARFWQERTRKRMERYPWPGGLKFGRHELRGPIFAYASCGTIRAAKWTQFLTALECLRKVRRSVGL